jgi:uncharacterized membrane protein YkvI
MKKYFLIPLFIIAMTGVAAAASEVTEQEQELINLSKQKWQWMADRNVDSLDVLFHENAVFVHMGGAMPKRRNSALSEAAGFTTNTPKFRKRRYVSPAIRLLFWTGFA